MALVTNAQEEEYLRSASTLTAEFCIGFRAGTDFLSGPQANDLAHDPCSFWQASRIRLLFRITSSNPNSVRSVKPLLKIVRFRSRKTLG
jgi:hypothetical protein